MTTTTPSDLAAAAAAHSRELVRRWEERFGVDLRSILDDGQLSAREKSRRARARLVPAVIARLERLAAKDDLVPRLDGFDHRGLIASLTDSEVPIAPNYFITKGNVATVLGYRGTDIFTYVTSLQNALDSMSKESDPTAVATEMSLTGIVGFLGEAARVAVTLYRAGGVTVIQAIAGGIRGVGMLAVGGIIAVLAIELLIFLGSNEKRFLGVVVNDSDTGFVVANWRDDSDDAALYLAHGDITTFMESHTTESLSSPVVQLLPRITSSDAGDLSVVCAAGIYTAEKNFGFFGAEGAMVFSPAGAMTPSISFALLFACPYSKDNGTNVYLQAGNAGGGKAWYDALYDTRKLYAANEAQGYLMQATCNAASGGVATGIAGIVKK